ncbi:MAG: YHS domain-containing (seleno)protein [Pseudomonadota bacterium]
MTFSRRAILMGASAVLIARPAFAKEPRWYDSGSGYAADGADVVAYFSLDKSAKGVKGSSEHSIEWNGMRWRFANAENLAAFKANPEKYAPQFGGYCSWAVSQGYTAHGDRDAWTVENGKLYLNYNNRIRNRWLKDVQGFIAQGEANWPSIIGS